jgi:AraC family transcriptional regulator
MEARHSLRVSYAEVLRSRTVAGLILAECRYRPDLEMPRHWHDHAHFYLVLQGSCADTRGQVVTLCQPSSLVFIPAGEPHANQYHGQGTRTFDIELEPRWMRRIGEYSEKLDRPCDFQRGLPVWLAARIYNEFCEMDTAAPLAIEGLALELLAEASRRARSLADRRPPPWLREARELLNAQFTSSLRLDAVARAVGVHPTHLAREFRRHYRRTIGEYLRELRIEYARRELSTSDAPLVEIAVSAGFTDQSHFSKAFKRHTGLTPTQFRESFRLR